MLWERVHVLNRLVRDMLVEKTKAFFPRYFAPRYVGLIFRLVDTDIARSRARYSSRFLHSRQCSFPFDYQHLSRTVTVAQRCLSLHAAFLLSLAWRDLARRLRL